MEYNMKYILINTKIIMKNSNFKNKKIWSKHEIKILNIIMIFFSIIIWLWSIVVFANLNIQSNLDNSIQTIKRIMISIDWTDNEATRLFDINADVNHRIKLYTGNISWNEANDLTWVEKILWIDSNWEMIFVLKTLIQWASGSIWAQWATWATGAMWTTWPAWPQWIQWIQWNTGEQWIQWIQWNTWTNWINWTTGAIGATWPVWPQWIQWIQWNTGEQWIQWIQWNTWTNWINWTTGAIGATWPQWIQWIQWNTGEQWIQWIPWVWSWTTGAMWATWPAWPQWIQWNTGAIGATWPQWIQWIKWNTWTQWNTWAQWIQWIQWIQWETWTWFADNLWNHIATMNIRLWSNRLSYTWSSYWLKVLSNNNIQISDMLEVSCGSNIDNKWIKIWDNSYIYDDACGWWWTTTLHLTSDDAVAITSNSLYGIYVNTNWKVWIGGGAIPTVATYTLDVTGTGRFTKDLYVGGRLWIWTTIPSYNLQVNTLTGDQGLGIFSIDWYSRLRFGTIGSYFANLWELKSSPDWSLSIVRSNVSRLPAAITITSWNNIWIWTTSPAYNLDVFGTGRYQKDLYISWRVGIWTAYPSQKLVVSWTAIVEKLFAGNNAWSTTNWDVRTNNGWFTTYLWKRKNESNSDSANYWLVINDIVWMITQVGIRVAMKNMNQKAAVFLWKVGIWEESPTAPLDVNGNIKVWQSSTSCTSTNYWEIRYDGYCFKWCSPSWWEPLNACTAPACWSAHNQNLASAPSNPNLCLTWTATPSPATNNNTPTWYKNRTWTCTLNAQTASCRAHKPINGVCDSDHYFCTVWQSQNNYCHAHPVPDNMWDFWFSWKCNGYNGWTMASCTQQIFDNPSQAWCED